MKQKPIWSDPQEIWDMMRTHLDWGIDEACRLLPDTPENAAGRKVLRDAQREANRLFSQWLADGFRP